MFQLTKRAEYGILALKYMGGQPAGSVTSAKELADRYNIPLDLLAKILQKLARSGLIRSTQGMYGGYTLARSDLSLGEVLEVIEGPLSVVICYTEGGSACDQLNYCTIKGTMNLVNQRVKDVLDEIRLSEMSHIG